MSAPEHGKTTEARAGRAPSYSRNEETERKEETIEQFFRDVCLYHPGIFSLCRVFINRIIISSSKRCLFFSYN